MEWSRETILQFIKILTERPAYWNPLSIDYSNKRKRQEAIEEIGLLMGITPMEVNSKWIILRNQFNRERRKIIDTKDKATPYVSKWYAYKKMAILMAQTKQKRHMSNFWMQERDSDEEQNSISPPTTPPGRLLSQSHAPSQPQQSVDTDKTASILNQAMETLKAMGESHKDRNDELTNYGLYIAAHIRKYPPALQSKAKFEINKILYAIDLENIGQYATSTRVVDDDVDVHESKFDPLND